MQPSQQQPFAGSILLSAQKVCGREGHRLLAFIHTRRLEARSSYLLDRVLSSRRRGSAAQATEAPRQSIRAPIASAFRFPKGYGNHHRSDNGISNELAQPDEPTKSLHAPAASKTIKIVNGFHPRRRVLPAIQQRALCRDQACQYRPRRCSIVDGNPAICPMAQPSTPT